MSKAKSTAKTDTSNELADILTVGVENNDIENLLASMEEINADPAPLVGEILDAEDTLDTAFFDSLMADAEDKPDPVVVTIDVMPDVEREAFYEEQTSLIQTASDEDAAPVISMVTQEDGVSDEAAPTKTKRALTARKAPKDPLLVGAETKKSATFKTKEGMADLTSIGFEESAIAGLIETIESAPAKVQEKSYNMVRYCLGREHISNYSRIAIQMLEKGPISVVELVKYMTEERRYSIGTARSQSQQISRLFKMFNMVDIADGKMVLNREQPFVKSIVARLAA